MTYIWINPVTESMYQGASLDDFLIRCGFIRVKCTTDWGRIVKEKYKTFLTGCQDTVADARCPMACDLIKEIGEIKVVTAPIEPILIHCAREISGREDLKDGEKLITTPCRSLADMGNGLKLPDTCFTTWNELLQTIGERPEGRTPDASPIPPGFFSGIGVNTESITGKDNIEEYVKQGHWRNVRLMELLYCKHGCHNGDGVVMDEP